MKASRFNIFIDTADGKKLAFNSASAALAEITADKYPIIERLLRKNSTPQSEEEKQYYEILVNAGYLVDENIEEVSSLQDENRSQRLSRDTLFLTIAPTLACNFACDYCFESIRPERMTPEIESDLVVFAERHMRDTETLMVTWFGGEPTLCVNSIERIQAGLRDKAEKNGVAVSPASIVTNGYLLDGKMGERLKKAGVGEAQVTLDGPQRVHDSRRKLKSGKGTFSRIIENLAESADILKIGIRINIDHRNIDGVSEIVASLDHHNLLDRVGIYFAQVNSSENICSDMKGRCQSTEEFSSSQVKLYEELIEAGYNSIEYPMLAPGGYCGADSINSFVIAPNGSLFKCWEEVAADNRYSIGNIRNREQEEFQKLNLEKYMNWDPFKKRDCVECEVLPICMGGCPHQGIKENSEERGHCISWKHNLGDMLRLRYLCECRKEVRT